MQKENLTPRQSLDLITQVINQARSRFEENGFIYAFWGTLIALASLGQFYLLQAGRTDIHWYPYLLLPLGFVFTTLYYIKKKKKRTKNVFDKSLAGLWNILGLYMMVLGFLFAGQLRENLLPVILLLLSVGMTVSGILIRQRILLFSGVLIGGAGIYAFSVDLMHQPLLTGIIAIIAILIPGIVLMYRHKRLNNV